MDLMELDLKRFILIMGALSFIVLTLSCFYIFTPDDKEDFTLIDNNSKLEKIKVNESLNKTKSENNISKVVYIYQNKTRLINQTNIINVTRTKYINRTIEYKLNITKVQIDLIYNMKPDVCHTVGCSKGYDMAKREFMDIMDWKKPKFKEAWKTGYMELLKRRRQPETTATFNILNDTYGQYISLNGSFWRVNHPVNYSVLENITETFNNLNVSVNYSVNDLVNRDEIILRRL